MKIFWGFLLAQPIHAFVLPMSNHLKWRYKISSSLAAEVICVGDALFDCIAEDSAAGWDIDRVVEENAWTAWPGGAPANVATALNKLGTTSAFAGAIGQDKDGDKICDIFSSLNVDTSLVRRTGAAPTRRVMVTRDIHGDRTFACFAGKAPPGAFADCLYNVEGLTFSEGTFGDAGWIVSSTLSLAFEESRNALTTLVDYARGRGMKVLVDINWRDVFWLPNTDEETAKREILEFASRADIVKLTDDEAEWLFDISADDAIKDPERIHRTGFPNAKGVVVTGGGNGAGYSILKQTGFVPAFSNVGVVETTGAGDAFTAGLIHACLGLNLDWDMDNTTLDPSTFQSVVTFASAVGALTCTGEGGIPPQPYLKEVEAFLSDNIIPS